MQPSRAWGNPAPHARMQEWFFSLYTPPAIGNRCRLLSQKPRTTARTDDTRPTTTNNVLSGALNQTGHLLSTDERTTTTSPWRSGSNDLGSRPERESRHGHHAEDDIMLGCTPHLRETLQNRSSHLQVREPDRGGFLRAKTAPGERRITPVDRE